jgi:LacI family transcriptional regulator
MNPGGVTIKMLAEQLNISTATVSKALNDSHEISLPTKNRVWALAKALNYSPNPAASNLRSHKSKTIAVIIPSVANTFFSMAIKGIEEVARQYGYHVLIYQTQEDVEMEMAFINSLLNGRVDGILTSVSSSEDNNAFYQNLVHKIPLVFFDRVYESMDTFKVTTNDYAIAYQATEHLLACGCRKIGFLYGLAKLPAGQARLSGYQDALNNYGLQSDELLIVHDAGNETANQETIEQLLRTQRPDGLFSSIEEFIIPAYNACRKTDLVIPRDIKILSFCNLTTAALLNPPLTTVTQPAFEMGKEAAKCLFQIFHNKGLNDDQHLVLNSSLIQRGSTGF